MPLRTTPRAVPDQRCSAACYTASGTRDGRDLIAAWRRGGWRRGPRIGRAATEVGHGPSMSPSLGAEWRRSRSTAAMIMPAAIAALRDIERRPRLLHGIIPVAGETLDGRNLPVLRHPRRSAPRCCQIHGAGATDVDAAA